MAIIMQNPDNVPGAVSTGYQLQNELLYAGNTGFCNVNFNLYDTNFGAYIYGGSIFEMNGKLIKLTIHEYISGINSIPYNSYFYIYAKMNGTSVSFYASTNPPTWDIDKCGFYYANDRALVKVALMGNGKFAQVHFDTDIHNSTLIVPQETDAKILIKEITGEKTEYVTLKSGWYHVIASGAGGGAYRYAGIFYKGGDGGYISHKFFVPYDYDNTMAKLTTGLGGKDGNQNTANTTIHPSTAGKNSSFEWPAFSMSIIAYGGGGGAGTTSGTDGKYGGNNINYISSGGGGKGGYIESYDVTDAEAGKITIYKFS